MSTISPIVPYRDLRAAIDFLCDAFGFERHALHEDGEGNLTHVELRLGDDFIMPTEPREAGHGDGVRIPLGSEHQLYVVVEDADAHHDRAKAAGAEIVMALRDTDYGSRDYAAKDPEGNTWYFGTYRPGA
jgi:uncharacterized glyoxalase superfamily protein PhnB